MQQVGSSLSTENRVASRRPSVALVERNQAATLPVQLLKDDPAALQGNHHAPNGFQVKLDAHGFAPEELMVRVDGQRLIMTGERQIETSDPKRGSYRMSQKVHRQMRLPREMDPTAMTCSLTPSGQLWVRGQHGALRLPEVSTERQL
ncbi:heat shock protein beta-9 [Otolemur garnettii]|nr:heat shock protein beta-9 [Otolemur garnettii]